MTPRRLIVLFALTLMASCRGGTPPPVESETDPPSRHLWDTRFAERSEDERAAVLPCCDSTAASVAFPRL